MARNLPARAPSKPIQIKSEFVTLPEGENNERIERLTRKILRAIQLLEAPGSRSRLDSRPKSKQLDKGIDEIFETSFEKALGL